MRLFDDLEISAAVKKPDLSHNLAGCIANNEKPVNFQDKIVVDQHCGQIRLNNQDILLLGKSPVNVTELELELADYKHEDANFLLSGFKFGFSINYTGPKVSTECNNLKSAVQNPKIVQQKIDKELKEQRIAGPFAEPPFPQFRVSPIGLVPKKQPGEFRLIHHLSYPQGFSVNDFIDSELCSVQYTSFDAAVAMVQEFGKNTLLAKSDVKSAFRLLCISPTYFDQLGFKFQGQYYFDKCMPFGCSISCSTFEKFAKFLEFMVKNKSPRGLIIHFLDDFLMAGKQGTNDCQALLDQFHQCLQRLSVPIATEKTEGPTTCLIFLGLEIDSVEMVVRIPMNKLIEIRVKITEMLKKEKVTLRCMQSLIGALNFACRAIIPGRPFCRRLINAICGLTVPHHHLRINKGIRQDLKMWLRFFQDFNGVSVFHNRFWVSNVDVELYTDSAAGWGLGCAAYFAGKWAFGAWPVSWFEQEIVHDITTLELFPIFVSLHIWGAELRNKKLLFHCDNMAVVQVVNSMTSKSEKLMVLLREITIHCLKLNIVIKAKHINGVKNVLTDALSRLQVDKFRRLAPGAEKEPAKIPDHLWNLFSREQNLC